MATFEAMIDKGGFVEHAKFGGNRYGTSKKMIGELTAGGRVCVLDIEMEVCSSLSSLSLFSHSLLYLSAYGFLLFLVVLLHLLPTYLSSPPLLYKIPFS